MNDSHSLRQLGTSDLWVSAVGFGCWPIAGISSLDVTDDWSVRTLQAAFDAGINFFDTAFSYGYDGDADRLLRTAFSNCRERIVIASKVGSHYDSDHRRIVDGRPATLIDQAAKILKRLDIEHVDLLYLHQPDPTVAIEESAGAIMEIVARGWARYAAVSNVNADQLRRFNETCPVIAVQPPYNMLQQSDWLAIRDYCIQHSISAVCYWVLMKGLLAGKLLRDHKFDPRDRRLTYSIYQGEQWERSQNFLDRLRGLSAELGCTVSQLVIAWTIQQPGITVALCGAKRPEQIIETASSTSLQLVDTVMNRIDGWLLELNAGAASS
jgi:aryl-alcohol dehydrogenase-like predicted oxidoreductase